MLSIGGNYGLSSRSGRKRKAWGASPRIKNQKSDRARGAGDSLFLIALSPASRAQILFCFV